MFTCIITINTYLMLERPVSGLTSLDSITFYINWTLYFVFDNKILYQLQMDMVVTINK